MSNNTRRPADRSSADRNQAALRTLLREPGNKVCADCKSHAHPRWASWNIGVFICIRCSGIHRSMGTHVSRVKSVDLDTWTDDQVANMVKWGNERANKYWEAGLPEGHIPAEGKIDNFIRTKYELRRWVAGNSGPEPVGAASKASSHKQQATIVGGARVLKTAASPVLAYHRRTSSLEKSGPPPRAAHATKNRSIDRPVVTDLLGLDTPPQKLKSSSTSQLHGNTVPTHNGSNPLSDISSSSSASTPNLQTQKSTSDAARPDLKRSILSLYASMPKQQQPIPGSPSTHPAQNNSRQTSFSNHPDAFSSLASSASAAASSGKGGDSSLLDLTNVFSGVSLTNPSAQTPSPSSTSIGSFGNFTSQTNNNNGLKPQRTASNASSIPSSIFDTPSISSPPATASTTTTTTTTRQTAATKVKSPISGSMAASQRRKPSNTDIFSDIGASDAWSAPAPSFKPSPSTTAWASSPLSISTANPLSPKNSVSAPPKQPETTLASLNTNYFSNSSAGPTKITADEEFGEFSGGEFNTTPAVAPSSGSKDGSAAAFAASSEWSSFESAPPSSTSNAPPDDDLFSNVWK